MAKEPAIVDGPWSIRPAPSHPRRGPSRGILLVGAVTFAVAVMEIPGYVQQWLWMRQLDYLEIFWTLISVQWGMFFSSFIFAFLFIWINLRHAARIATDPARDRSSPRSVGPWGVGPFERSNIQIPLSWAHAAIVAASAVVAWGFAMGFSADWDAYLRFRYGASYGLSDPLLGIDVGFYIFRLPFYELGQRVLFYLTITTLVAVVALYAIAGLLSFGGDRRFDAPENISRHVSTLLFVIAAVLGWGFYLDRYNLVYSTLGIVYGAGYAASHVTLIALWTMIGASAVACALLAWKLLRPPLKAVAIGSVSYAALYFLGVLTLPALYQRYVVQPNELAMEIPYLKDYITFTRKAYGLDAIQETSYPALSNLTQAAVASNQDTIDNIRLWDARPLLQTYFQTQAIRLYYHFYSVDTDRYHLRDGYHQVMLSARELSPELPPQAQTWVNQYLQFTHGYGLVMNFVSKTVADGVPEYILKDIPPQSTYGASITQPSIYYGKSMPGYRIVATNVKEFDYPRGNNNVYTSYTGKGGILLDSFWKRLLFAWTQSDVNLLLSSYLNPESRIQIWRRVHERVTHIAPFLRLDNDPYPVLSEGKLYWIQDAYTISEFFPYASPVQTTDEATQFEPETMSESRSTDTGGPGSLVAAGFANRLNYIRNSVKIVVDMYDGSVRFYIMDSSDPILAAYRRAFPSVFRELGQLPNDLKNHLRYPQDLFAIQAEQYRTFHMTDPQVFYNREDLWQFPIERYAGEARRMRPNYILVKLPGGDNLQYILMTPFTPQNRDNMISWMAAKSDFPDYGKMFSYELPKERLIYGPKQVEAMIDQNTTISQQLTLWDQRGSHVIRGQQIVTPIANSFLYVVPLYLSAAGTAFPQLKRVIAVMGDRVAMAPSLDAALNGLFAPQQLQTGAPQRGGAPAAASAQEPALEQARLKLEAANKAMQKGDWKQFGKAMQELEQQLVGKTE
jgi:uncharacterized protein